MREIKFRAWDGLGQIKSMKSHDDIKHIPLDFFLRNDKNGLKLMQYTGLKDKNGKEIYESDVLRGEDGRNNVTFEASEVLFIDGSFCIKYANGSSNSLHRLRRIDGGPIWEVIGNIHENPELLEKEK